MNFINLYNSDIVINIFIIFVQKYIFMFQYQILETGFFYADGGAMFGAIPKRAWNRRYSCDEQNCCKMSMRCLLVWNKDKVILLDSGVGSKDLGSLAYYRFFDLQDITTLVRSCGFEPDQVTDVVLSHLHFDHCGGCTYRDGSGNLKITFPEAKHWVGKAQWDSYLYPNHLEQDAFRPEDMMLIAESGILHTIAENSDLFEDFRVELYDGHTNGQLVSFFKTANDQIVYPSDVIPTKAHCSIDWISAYDVKPLESVDSKLRLIEKIKNDKGFMIFYHDVYNKSIPLSVRK